MPTTRSRATTTTRAARPRPSAGAPDRARYVALLRGINVGRRQVPKDVLRHAFVRAGGRGVRTFLQSGNVAFDSSPGAAAAVVAGASRRLSKVLGADPLVMLRSAADIAQLARSGPFARTAAPPVVKRYIVFLASAPARRPRLPVRLRKEALELVHVSKRECWVVSRRKSNGWYGFPVEFVESAVGVPATARGWSTVTKLAAWL